MCFSHAGTAFREDHGEDREKRRESGCRGCDYSRKRVRVAGSMDTHMVIGLFFSRNQRDGAEVENHSTLADTTNGEKIGVK